MIQLLKVRRYIFLIYIFLLPLFASNTFFGKIPFSIFFTLILMYLSFLETLRKGKLCIRITGEDKLLMAFTFICIVSIVFSNNIESSFIYFIGLLPQLFIYIFMKKEFSVEKINIIKVLVLSSGMVAIINAWQVREAIKIYGYKSNDIFASINYYGSIVAFSIPLIIYLLKNETKNRKLYYMILIINIISSLWSFSKVAIGLIGIYFIYYVFSFLRKRGKNIRKIILIITIFVGIFVGIKFITSNNIHNANLNKMIENFTSGDSFETRKVINNVSKNMIKDNFFTGVGIGNYKLSTFNYSELYYDYHPGSEAHDLMLSIFSETGIFGAIIFMCMLLFSLYSTKKNNNKDLFMYEIGVIFSSMFYGFGLKSWYIWIILSISSCISLNKKSNNT